MSEELSVTVANISIASAQGNGLQQHRNACLAADRRLLSMKFVGMDCQLLRAPRTSTDLKPTTPPGDDAVRRPRRQVVAYALSSALSARCSTSLRSGCSRVSEWILLAGDAAFFGDGSAVRFQSPLESPCLPRRQLSKLPLTYVIFLRIGPRLGCARGRNRSLRHLSPIAAKIFSIPPRRTALVGFVANRYLRLVSASKTTFERFANRVRT